MDVINFKQFLNEKNIIKLNKKTFFISDTHFQDDRLNLYGRDLLFKNAEDVDDFIIKKWNEVVSKDDLVIHCGDVSLNKKGLDILKKLNGELWLVRGNYDKSINDGGTAKYEINNNILSKYFTKIFDEIEIDLDGEKIYINHFPTNCKPNMMNITGHIHGTWKVQRNMINVGVDAWHFVPVSDDLIKFQINGIRNHYDQNVFAGELISNIKNKNGSIRILRAPDYDNVATFNENKDIVIFLAGPIQGTNMDVIWQEELIKKIQNKTKDIKLNKDIIIASPRRLEKPENFIYDEQVDWETFYLNKAGNDGIIVFWLAEEYEKIEGRSFAQTTRFEIGEWFAKGKNINNFKILIGIDPKFEGSKYISYKFKQEYPELEIQKNLEKLSKEIVSYLKTKF
jgi:calcineurin-like phosphoesterase family protein